MSHSHDIISHIHTKTDFVKGKICLSLSEIWRNTKKLVQVFIQFPTQSNQHMSKTSTHINPFKAKSYVSFLTLSNEAPNACWVREKKKETKLKPCLWISDSQAAAFFSFTSVRAVPSWTKIQASSTWVSRDLYLSFHSTFDEWVIMLIAVFV